MNFVIVHLPHAIPVVLVWGLLLRFWRDQRRAERAAQDGPPPAQAVALPHAPATPVRRSTATRGLLALGPLIGALATGLVIYALNLGRGHAAAAAVWTHVGISLLAMLLVGYKLADLGRARLRASLTSARVVRSGGSIVLLALWVPLLVSGIALAIAPGAGSFMEYAHLIASIWWTGLLVWHLRRYVARAMRAALEQPAASTPRRRGEEAVLGVAAEDRGSPVSRAG